MQDVTEILSKLEYLQNKYITVVSSVDDTDLEKKIQEGEEGWTTIEILRHIPIAEVEITKLMEKVVSGSSGVTEEFDIDQQNAKYRQRYTDMGIEQIKDQMRNSRKRTLTFLKNTSAENWEKSGKYFNQEEMSVARMFQILMWHQNHHTKQIIEKLDLDI